MMIIDHNLMRPEVAVFINEINSDVNEYKRNKPFPTIFI